MSSIKNLIILLVQRRYIPFNNLKTLKSEYPMKASTADDLSPSEIGTVFVYSLTKMKLPQIILHYSKFRDLQLKYTNHKERKKVRSTKGKHQSLMWLRKLKRNINSQRISYLGI